MSVIMPKVPHRCPTPGNLQPRSEWPIRRAFGRDMRVPVLWPIGARWTCPHCGRCWRAHDLPPNPPGGGYHGGGLVWRRLYWWHLVPARIWFSLFAVLVSLVAVLMSVALLLGWWR